MLVSFWTVYSPVSSETEYLCLKSSHLVWIENYAALLVKGSLTSPLMMSRVHNHLDYTLFSPTKLLKGLYTWLAVGQDAYLVSRLNDVRTEMLRCNSNGQSLYLAWYPCDLTSTKFRTEEKTCEEGHSSPCHMSNVRILHCAISDNP